MAYQQGIRGTGSERGQQRDPRYAKTCLECGQTYHKYVCCSLRRWENSKWCSVSCRARWMLRKGQIGRNFLVGVPNPTKGTGATVPCRGCGAPVSKHLCRNFCDKPGCREASKTVRYQRMGRSLAAKATPRGEGALILEPHLVARGWQPEHVVTVGGHTYRLDFADPERQLCIEVDGISHHARRMSDAERTRILVENGWMVLRFWNSEVRDDLPGVLAAIWPAARQTGSV